MAKILPRSVWTGTPNGRASRPLKLSKLQGITLHWPADPGTLPAATVASTSMRLRGYRGGHLARGWVDIGYNYAIDQAGNIFNLTGMSRGAHAGTDTGNMRTVGVLMVLGMKERPSRAMTLALDALHAEIMKAAPKATGRYPHKHWKSTQCPGPYITALTKTHPPTPITPDKPARPWFVAYLRNLGGYNAHGAKTWKKRLPGILADIDLAGTRPQFQGILELPAKHRPAFDRAMKARGYRRAAGSRGRYLYVSAAVTIIAAGTFDLRPRLNNDSKEAAYLVFDVAGIRGIITAAHLEHEKGFDGGRVLQFRNVIKQADDLARKYKVDPSNIVHMADTNSDTWVTEKAANPAGFVSFRTAPTFNNRELSTFVGWSGAWIDGVGIDQIYASTRRPILAGGIRRPKPGVMDHAPIAATIGKVPGE